MPRPEPFDGLYISVSQLKTFLMCPRKYELHYIRGEPPAFVPVALAFGSAIHEALATHYQEVKLTGEALRRDLLLDVFRSAWEKQCSGPIPLQAAEDEDDGIQQTTDRGVSMLHAFSESAATNQAGVVVDSVERPFEVDIHDPDTGEVLDEKLVGVIDLIALEGDRRVIWEHKTATKRFGSDQLRFDVQPSAYHLAARAMGMGDVGLKYQVLTKTKIPAIHIADVERTAQDEDDLLRTVQGVLRSIDAGVSYPMRGWMCRSCPYIAACNGSSS